MTPSRKTRLARQVVLASYVLSVLVVALHHTWLVLPLLLFAWGLWRENWRSHIWLCFVLLFYFLLNINQLAVRPGPWLALECALVVTLFTSAMLYCRWVKQAPAESSVGEMP